MASMGLPVRWMALPALLLAGAAAAGPMQLIGNGGFETGDFTAWTTVDETGSSGAWFVASGTISPLSAFPTAGPAAGTFYAVTDQLGPGAHVLEQSFAVPLGTTSVVVAFDMFRNDQSGNSGIVGAQGLDFNGDPNQHARVDILASGAGAFSTASADIVDNLVAPGADPSGSNPNPYTHYVFDVTAVLTPGNSYLLRFGEVDNQLFFQQGVDNVSVVAEVGAGVPEPPMLALLLFGLLGGIAASRRRAAA